MFWKKNTLVVTGDHSGNEKEATDLTGFLNPHDCFGNAGVGFFCLRAGGTAFCFPTPSALVPPIGPFFE